MLGNENNFRMSKTAARGPAPGPRQCARLMQRLPKPSVEPAKGDANGRMAMYLARFSYDVLPVNRQRALDFIRREVEAARSNGLNARLLVPLTRGHGNGVALQCEVELTQLDQLDQFRNRGIGSPAETGNWMQAFSEVLIAPPAVEILHV